MTTQMRDPKAKQISFLNQDLRNRTFKNQDLSEVDFRYAEMEGAIFDHCKLNISNFEGAELKGVKFINKCQLVDTKFINADMSDVEIDDTCIVSKIDLTKACIIGLILPDKIGSITDNTVKLAKEFGMINLIPRYA